MGWLSSVFGRGTKVVTKDGKTGVVLGGNDWGGYDVEVQGRFGSRTERRKHAGSDIWRTRPDRRLRGTPGRGDTVIATKDLSDRYGSRVPKGAVGRVVRDGGLFQSGYTVEFENGERSHLYLGGDIAKADGVSWGGPSGSSAGPDAGEILGEALAKLIDDTIWAITTTFRVVWWMSRRRWGRIVLGVMGLASLVVFLPVPGVWLLILLGVPCVAVAAVFAWRHRVRLRSVLGRLAERLRTLADRDTRSLESISPDGQWRWTGTTWVPTEPPAPRRDDPGPP
jgi:hypothetical protein